MKLFNSKKTPATKVNQLNKTVKNLKVGKEYFLDKDQAVALLVYLMTNNVEIYPTGVIQWVKEKLFCRVSDTVLYAALKFLEGEENKEDLTLVTSRWQKVEGRGRPRRMYKLNVQEYPDMSSLTFQTLVEWSTFALRFKK